MASLITSMKIIEHPHLFREVIKFKRVRGGFQNKWLIRTEYKELEQFAIICGEINTMYVTPQTAAIIRNYK